MTFFERVKLYADPRLSDEEVSAALNRFETALFTLHPEALDLSEDAQNALVLTAWAHAQTKH